MKNTISTTFWSDFFKLRHGRRLGKIVRAGGIIRLLQQHWARIAEEICQRLKAPKKLTGEVVRLTALHMYDLIARIPHAIRLADVVQQRGKSD